MTNEKNGVLNEAKIDEESCKGRFGWCDIDKENKNFIPFIYRKYTKETEKYIMVRWLEQKLISKFLNVLPTEATSCFSVPSYYITEGECKLLNEINLNHCNFHFGKTTFNGKDLIVKLDDATQFYNFLVMCYKRLVKKQCDATDRCGFVRIGGESVVPFTMHQSKKYVPIFYFEEVTEQLRVNASQIEGVDLAYLKFCCKVQGIRQSLFASEVIKVVPLDEIKAYFPPGTTFEDYWPARDTWQIQSRNVPSASWTIKPSSEGHIYNFNSKENNSLSRALNGNSAASKQQTNGRLTPQQQQMASKQQTNGRTINNNITPAQKQASKTVLANAQKRARG